MTVDTRSENRPQLRDQEDVSVPRSNTQQPRPSLKNSEATTALVLALTGSTPTKSFWLNPTPPMPAFNQPTQPPKP